MTLTPDNETKTGAGRGGEDRPPENWHKSPGYQVEEPDRPRGTGGLLDETFVFYVRNFFQILAMVAVPGVAYTVFGYIIAPAMFGFRVATIVRNLPEILIGVVLLIPLFALLSGMVAYAIAETRLGRRASPLRAWRFVRSRVRSLVGARLVSGIGLLAVAAVGMGVFYLLAGAGQAPVLGIIFSFILACVWLYLYLTWLFVEQAVLFENCSAWEALKRSDHWASGRRWNMFWTILITHMVVTLISATPSPLSALPGLAIPQILTLPLYSVAAALLYFDARVRRESFRSRDLRQLLGESS